MSLPRCFHPLHTMRSPLTGDSEAPSPREIEAAGRPGRDAFAESSAAPVTNDVEQDQGSDTESVTDSAIETDNLSTMTVPEQSLTSVEENGRTYHSYKSPSRCSISDRI